MAFVSKNEIEQFSFDDCQIDRIENTEKDIILYLDALIVKERNSQNSNFTLSYADTVKATLKNAKIYSVILAGYRVYDANDNLLEEIPDEAIPEPKWKNILKGLGSAYLYRMSELSKEEAAGLEDNPSFVYDIEVETFSDAEVPDLRDDAYTIRIGFDESVFTWDRYLNRVQNY